MASILLWLHGVICRGEVSTGGQTRIMSHLELCNFISKVVSLSYLKYMYVCACMCVCLFALMCICACPYILTGV